MGTFRIEKIKESRDYILHVEDNGMSGRYILDVSQYLFIRGGSVFNAEERPPTREEFDSMIEGLTACAPTPPGREREVLEAFRAYTCD